MSLQMDLSSALSSRRYLNKNNTTYNTHAIALTTGKRINSAADDASGLSITSRMNTELLSYDVALRNNQQYVKIMEMYDGVAETIGNNFQRMRQLAVYAANGTLTDPQRSALNVEYTNLRSASQKLVSSTKFNTVGHFFPYPTTMQIQYGINASDVKSFATDGPNNAVFNMAVHITTAGIYEQGSAITAISTMDIKLYHQTAWRTDIANRITQFENIISSQETLVHNLKVARGRILDADMAHHASGLAKTMVKKSANMQMLQLAQQNMSNLVDIVNSI